MKKIVLILMVVIVLGMLGEGLYTALAKLDTAQDMATAYKLDDIYPCGMPNLVIDPFINCALF